jgi:hypothetical protein
MFGWFAKSSLPDEEMIDWLFDVFEWLIREASLDRRALILPTDTFFPIEKDLDEHARALAFYGAVKRHARLDDCRCRLVPLDEEPELPRSAHFGPMARSGAAGTFQHGARGGVISYATSKVADPVAFVAMLAHELGHWMQTRFRREAPPGGPKAVEPATDVCAVFLGFGVFSANAAFRFQQHARGWSYGRLGYLDEKPLAYALAIFLALHELGSDDARRHLDANPRSYLKHAAKHLEERRSLNLQRLRLIRRASS